MSRTKTLSRAEAAAILGWSVPTLRRREGVQIHPILTDLGEHRFVEREVLDLRKAIQRGRALGLVSGRARETIVAEELRKKIAAKPRRPCAPPRVHGTRLARFQEALAGGATSDELRKRFNLTRQGLTNLLNGGRA